MDGSGELALQLPPALPRRPLYRNKRTRRPTKYPYHMVEDARAMRANGYLYTEIASALAQHYAEELRRIGVEKIPWITVRDWTQCYYRVRG